MITQEDGWLRKADLARHFNVDPSTIVRWSHNRKDFPQPTKLGDGVTAWHVTQIREYDRKLLATAGK